MSRIELNHVSKEWPGIKAVDDISLEVPERAFSVLLGPSGCGKSTILRMIAGLELVTSGTIFIDAKDVTTLDPSKRGISMVFQSYALFPHLTVKENICFGLKVRKVTTLERKKRLQDAAELVGLHELLERKPSQLSGGQRQRVALARTIVSRQPVCLMDEPLSNLDAKLRAEMRNEIRNLQKALGLTVLYVTHDQTEAMTMADQVILLKNGRIEQAGTPRELYTTPTTTFAAKFIGNPPMNIFLPEKVAETNSAASLRNGKLMGIRPEKIQLDNEGIPMQASSVDFLGAETLLYLQQGNLSLVSKITGHCPVTPGDQVTVSWNDSDVHLFDEEEVRLGQ